MVKYSFYTNNLFPLKQNMCISTKKHSSRIDVYNSILSDVYFLLNNDKLNINNETQVMI